MRAISFMRPDLWESKMFRALLADVGPMGGYVYAYLLSAPDSHITGLFGIREEAVARHTGVSEGDVTAVLAYLVNQGVIVREDRFVWLREMFAEQVGGKLSEGDTKNQATANYLKKLPPDLNLTLDFIMYYGLQGREPFKEVIAHRKEMQRREAYWQEVTRRGDS